MDCYVKQGERKLIYFSTTSVKICFLISKSLLPYIVQTNAQVHLMDNCMYVTGQIACAATGQCMINWSGINANQNY